MALLGILELACQRGKSSNLEPDRIMSCPVSLQSPSNSTCVFRLRYWKSDMTRQDSTQNTLKTTERIWHKSAPDGLSEAYRQGDQEAGWGLWRGYLAKRTEPSPLSELWSCDGNVLLWAADDVGIDGDTRRLLLGLQWLLEGPATWSDKASSWVEKTSTGPLDSSHALESVGWLHALPIAAATFEADDWWNLLDHLRSLALEASEMPLDGQPIIQQLVGGELALTMAYLFPEITPCRKMAKGARKILSAGMLELIDGEGLPNSRILQVFRPLMACWTRCRILGEQMDKACSSAKAGYQYEWAIRAALRLSRPDGSQFFSTVNGHRDDSELIAAALACGGDEDDEAIASLALPGRTQPKGLDTDLLPSPADHSAWASVAVLQPAWGQNEPKLATCYKGRDFRIELSQQKELLLAGTWAPEIELDGHSLESTSDWEELCWVSDNDIDYLELEIKLERGVRIQRHLAMAREDRFLFLADAIFDCPDGTIDYCGRFSLAENAGLAPAEETNEAFLMGQKAAAAVLPLALPEWRVEQSPGQLVAKSDAIELQLSGQGGALFAPLFLDLKPRRMTRPLTWRRLTVAESLEIVPPNVAVGYRVMVGKNQWLIYRSLTPPANRTLLGQNLATEMLIGRFDRKGEVEPLIEIEG